MKTLCIRFDIDTPTCLDEGVPRILDLTDRMGFKATFFLSVGRAISRSGALSRAVSGSRRRVERAAGYSSLHKLGLRRYLTLAALNPEIGRRNPEMVARLAAGAELGLHGGMNHDLWQNSASTWSTQRVSREIDWALEWLSGHGVVPTGFSSPGWTQPEGLADVLAQRGFTYRGDSYGGGLRGGVQERPGFYNIATNMVGEPAGVAYLEHMRARGLSDAEIRAEFKAKLLEIGDHVVLYDHPYYAGLHALGLLADLASIAIDEGFTLTTMDAMASRLNSDQRGSGQT